jgi:hypothetical protein
MLFSSGVPVAADHIIKHAAHQPLGPDIAASPENNRVWIKRRSQIRCSYLV